MSSIMPPMHRLSNTCSRSKLPISRSVKGRAIASLRSTSRDITHAADVQRRSLVWPLSQDGGPRLTVKFPGSPQFLLMGDETAATPNDRQIVVKRYTIYLSPVAPHTPNKTRSAPALPDPGVVDLSKPAGTLRLFLDPKTKVPLRFDSPTETRTYSYSSGVLPLRPPEHFKGA